MLMGGYGDYPFIVRWNDRNNTYMIRWGDFDASEYLDSVKYDISLRQAVELAYNNMHEWNLSLEKCLVIIKWHNEHCGVVDERQ